MEWTGQIPSSGIGTPGAGRRCADIMSYSCRPNCGACCIAPSINSPLPGQPAGKLAGVRCKQLTENFACASFGRSERPAFCASLKPDPEMCGQSRQDALTYLTRLEHATRPKAA